VDDMAGYSSSISSLLLGALNISTNLPAIFGTTRLQAWQSLSGTLCWRGVTPGTGSTVTVGMNTGLIGTLDVAFAGPAANPVTITASPAIATVSASTAKTPGQTTVAVALSDKTQNWTASIYPTNAAASWLTVAPLSGTGSGNLTVTASGAGFGPGVYRATIVIQSPNATPATLAIPVMFVYGSSTGVSITSIGNGATFDTSVSPGSLMSIFGSGLANSTNTVSKAPLPITLDGVSVRINGVDAPIVYISPTQINVQVPYEVGAGPAVLGVNNNGQIAGYAFSVSPTAPGIFADSGHNVVPAVTVKAGGIATLYFTGDGDVTPALLTGVTPSSSTSLASLPKSRLPLSVTVGGVPAFVQFYGITSGLVGASQLNFTVPSSVKPGVQPVVVTVGGVSSPPVNITVQ